MKNILCSTFLIAAAALAGCDQSDKAVSNNDVQANAAAPVVLPPSIAAQKVYRCKDNSLIYIDWYSDGSARVKNARNEAGTPVPAPAPDATEPPALVGSATATSITYDGKSCHV